MKPIVAAVVGPTAVGKTKLGVQLAQKFNGEVISGDSMQIYRTMDIGTAKVTEEEMQGVPHHMIDIKDPQQDFSAAEFQKRVQSLIYEIHERGKLPVLVGGTGLYIQATLFNFEFTEEKKDETIMKRLEEEAAVHGPVYMYERLERLDPDQAAKVHPNNSRRVLRALEIYETTGKKMSEQEAAESSDSPFTPFLIGLEMDRERLYERINTRVDQMMEEGLLDEVHRLYQAGLKDAQSMKAIGYKELIPYLEGDVDLQEAVDLLKRNSRRYAKRQYTYFKNKLDVHWYEVTPENYEHKFQTIFADLAGMIDKSGES
ncbi:tRNA (adenosine(37)-N6)-dimethylallyltransferase MiaA [Halobacillus litoralis]|uniref:tRNA (adenosine(37)-N6)-dimethylallyltransferase MiaA n=1 Tax=Halobacillus litoralis TaxID=45668 RepID=UPI001CD3F22B|nr:tRNA (adenosine(37)-N6)-dimethylallyltransferase MiaA [Halobacillus litoralis]MCA1023146.1 tRNA (adenosine(37)-N6)-dimethylallyltransferase MiaA [Halobacillus litoralis]